MKNTRFFDTIADFYDNMIKSRNAVKAKKKAFKRILGKSVKTAADLGCGSGNDSVALASLGIKVVGFDSSRGMVLVARKNSSIYKNRINFVVSGIDKISNKYNNTFNAAISLGNTIANVERKKLDKSFHRIYDILSPSGTFIMQALNYTAIKREGKRIINITRDRQYYYVRFYDIEKDYINFNILKFNRKNPKISYLITTKLLPYDKGILGKSLRKAGFKKINFYSDLSFNNFNVNLSKDLIIVAVKK